MDELDPKRKRLLGKIQELTPDYTGCGEEIVQAVLKAYVTQLSDRDVSAILAGKKPVGMRWETMEEVYLK